MSLCHLSFDFSTRIIKMFSYKIHVVPFQLIKHQNVDQNQIKIQDTIFVHELGSIRQRRFTYSWRHEWMLNIVRIIRNSKHCKQIQNKRNLRAPIKYFGVICLKLNKRILEYILTFWNIRSKVHVCMCYAFIYRPGFPSNNTIPHISKFTFNSIGSLINA